MQSNKVVLLGVLAAILVVKYALVPWYEAQSEQIAELSVTTRKLAKATALQEQKQVLDAELAKLISVKADLEKKLPNVADHNAISLQVQSDWQQFFESQGTELKLFNWTGQAQKADTPYWTGRVTLKLVGKFHQIAAASVRLQQKSPGLSYSSIRINRTQGLAFSDVAEAEFSVDVLYKLSPL
jgi:Tfp pilus assembly protein PilO